MPNDPYYADDWLTVLGGDCRTVMAAMEPESVQCVVTSPPYFGLRDYGIEPTVWGGEVHEHEWSGMSGGDPDCDHLPRQFADGCIECGVPMDEATDGCGHCADRQLKRQLRGTPDHDYQPRDPSRPDLPNPPASWAERDATPRKSDTCHKCGAHRSGFCPCGAWLGVLGLEPTIELYVAHMVEVFREVRRVLRRDGTVWLNLGDSYAGSANSGGANQNDGGPAVRVAGLAPKGGVGLKPKDRMMVPARVALALQADSWYLRDEIIWHKPNPMPSSVTDRTTPAHEMVYLLTKSARYFYDNEGIREPNLVGTHARGGLKRGEDADFRNSSQAAKQGGWNDLPPTENPAGRNKRSVWTIPTAPYGNFKIEAAPGQRDDDDGSGRTTSPDCPVHGDRRHREPTAGRGERPDASDPGRTPHNGRHHEQVPLFGLAPPIAQLPGRAALWARRKDGRSGFGAEWLRRGDVSDSEPDSSGSLLPECGGPATPRSTQSHRTDLAPATSPRAIADEGSSDRTGRTSPDAETAASDDRNPESKTGAGFAGDDTRRSSPAETPDRSACTCTSWVSVSHFAVFPPKLVEPCILAGSKPGDVVLDPFGGSGTVGMVAQMHSRRAVLIDLNPDYLAQQMRRNAQSPLGLGD